MERLRAEKNRGLLLFSGGVDSTLTALILKQSGVDLVALSIDYEGRPRGEKSAANRLEEQIGFSDTVTFSIGNRLSIDNGRKDGDPLEGWIPHRNLLFWAIAAHVAAKVGANLIAAGHDRSDADTFSDASPRFFGLLKPLLGIAGFPGRDSLPAVKLPLLEQVGSDDVARHHIATLDCTWSCWRDVERPCESCYACRRRRTFLRTLRTDHVG